MKILRAFYNGQEFYAELKDNKAFRLSGLPYEHIHYTGEEYAAGGIKLLAPCEPSKVVAVGLNYAKHAGEMKEALPANPIIFIKPSTSVIAHGEGIAYPPESSRVDYEAELAVVIKKRCRNVSADEASEYIFGYTALNDVTTRDLQKNDGQWTRAKSFDTFCPIGPYIDTEYDPNNKSIRSVLNGEIRQDGNTADMLYKVPQLVSFISSCMTLLPGDVIATGTPEGIGPMNRGDTIEIVIEGMSTLKNFVI